MLLQVQNTILVVIDVQGNLALAMHNKEKLIPNISKLVSGIVALNVPVVWTEQNPEKIGLTIAEVASAMPVSIRPISKMCFSCCGEKAFVDELHAFKRSDVLISGIEAHICVYQTAIDLMQMGYRAHVVRDCVSSRTPENDTIGVQKIKDMGGSITSAEMVLFELMKTAESPLFKDIFRIIK